MKKVQKRKRRMYDVIQKFFPGSDLLKSLGADLLKSIFLSVIGSFFSLCIIFLFIRDNPALMQQIFHEGLWKAAPIAGVITGCVVWPFVDWDEDYPFL